MENELTERSRRRVLIPFLYPENKSVPIFAILDFCSVAPYGPCWGDYHRRKRHGSRKKWPRWKRQGFGSSEIQRKSARRSRRRWVPNNSPLGNPPLTFPFAIKGKPVQLCAASAGTSLATNWQSAGLSPSTLFWLAECSRMWYPTLCNIKWRIFL